MTGSVTRASRNNIHISEVTASLSEAIPAIIGSSARKDHPGSCEKVEMKTENFHPEWNRTTRGDKNSEIMCVYCTFGANGKHKVFSNFVEDDIVNCSKTAAQIAISH
jgi:hypothetical protein